VKKVKEEKEEEGSLFETGKSENRKRKEQQQQLE